MNRITSKSKSNLGKINEHWSLLLMLTPGVIFLLIFNYLPISGVILAFKEYRIVDGIFASPWIGLDNFLTAFSDPRFLAILRNTVLISFYKLLFGMPVPIMFAILLSEIVHNKYRKIVQTISYLPYFISWVVLSGIFISILSLDGPVNSLLSMFGMSTHIFLADPAYFRTVIVITYIWQSFGWGAIIYFAAMAGIDVQLYEAAYMDGANRFKRIWHITIPGLIPTFIIITILSSSSILNAGFDQIFNMYSSTVYNVGDIIDTFVYRKGLEQMEYSFSTAIDLFKSVIAVIFILGTNKLVKMIWGSEYTLW